MTETTSLSRELDAAHARANASYRAKDLGGFMAMFAADLRYKQADGKTIGWQDLARDVGAQFMDVEEMDTAYVRESLQVDNGKATEVLNQTARLTMRNWVFFKRTWHLSRRGRYRWRHSREGWKIEDVEVLSETLRRGAA
jgi:hypothetical protein